MMSVAVEDHVPLIKKDGKLVKADGLIWSSVVQFGSRPTPESNARLGGEGVVDPHLHIHTFLFAMARRGDGWRQIDGHDIFRNAEFMQAVFENEISRLEEEAGVPMTYLEPDRKGRVRSEIEGSNPNVRQFLSTNSERAHRVRMRLEEALGRAPTRREYEREMQKTKGSKTKMAKEADHGESDYWVKVQAALDEAQKPIDAKYAKIRLDFEIKHLRPMSDKELADHEEAHAAESLTLTIADPGKEVSRQEMDERLEALYGRLEAPEGLVRDCDTTSVFGAEAIYPAAFRAAGAWGSMLSKSSSLLTGTETTSSSWRAMPPTPAPGSTPPRLSGLTRKSSPRPWSTRLLSAASR